MRCNAYIGLYSYGSTISLLAQRISGQSTNRMTANTSFAAILSTPYIVSPGCCGSA